MSDSTERKTEKSTNSVVDFFPLETPRPSQLLTIKEIESAFKSGYKVVILESPVGSGKSAIAMSFAMWAGEEGAHILTPRKALQDQYFDDFGDEVVLMKGRSAYPCTMESTPSSYKTVINAIKNGRINVPIRVENCADAPCKNNLDVFKQCTTSRPCPYTVAMETAQGCPVVIHNLHSFIFQASFGGKFEQRKLLIADEAHEIEGIVREFASKKVNVQVDIPDRELENLVDANKTIDDWEKFFLQDKYVPEESSLERARKQADSDYKSVKDNYLASVAAITSSNSLAKGFAVEVEVIQRIGSNQRIGISFQFIPVNLGQSVQSMILDFGEKILLMSGTVYDKDKFCQNLGIDPKSAYFLRVGSSFPVQNRPIYCLPKYQVDTSHANWNENFPIVVEKIREICSVFHDVKGLIHAPSYAAAEQLMNALNDPRFVSHNPGNFQEQLNKFYEDEGSRVFISPTCQQGVDFKGDRARFQIIIRVPFASTNSNFVSYMLKNNFVWYMYQALIVFGQQIGRVNRSPDDFGATFLLDSRFNRFISRASKMLPSWVKEAIVWK